MRGGSIRRALSIAGLAVIATFGLGSPGAARDVSVPLPTLAVNPIGFFDAYFSPKRLSKTRPTPVDFDFAARPRATRAEGFLKQFVLEADKRIEIDAKGIPTCELGGLGVRPSIGQVRRRCRPALVGDGRIETLVQFPEEPPISVKSEVLVINGGFKGGVKKLYLHSFLAAPVSAWIVTTMEIERIRNGRFGVKVLATFPKIAGGAGSITSFHLSLEKDVVSATCGADRYLKVHGKALFADGTNRSQSVVRTCTPVL